jgi:hypothetical protein
VSCSSMAWPTDERTCDVCGLADWLAGDHTPTMTLKNAALLALIGTFIIAALRVWDFIFITLAFVRGAVSAAEFLASLVYAFGACSLAIFFFVFQKRQT